MKCECHSRIFKNQKSLTNHLRWVKGLMSKNSFIGINRKENNGNWKGEDIQRGYSLHEWVNYNIGRNKVCENCGSQSFVDLANVTGNYERDFVNWKYLCRKCHMNSDGRINNLKQYGEVINI